MAVKIELKRSAVPGKVPATTDLELGEIAINTYDGKIYLKKDDGAQSIVQIAGGGSGSVASASYATFAATAGFASTAGSATTANSATSASFATTAGNASTATSASYALTASYFSGTVVSASYALSASQAQNAVSASYAATSSYANNFTVAGTLTAQTIVAQTITSSTEFITGSTKFGSLLSNTHQFTGSVSITGSLTAANANISGSFSGSLSNLQGSATYIPFFSSSQVLANSSMYQIGTASIAINQTYITTANPEALYVSQTHPTSINVISGKGNLDNYLQLNIFNTNQGVSASSDIVATANNGNETSNYIDMGINSELYSQNFIGAANDAYIYSTGNDLHIGNATPNKPLQFFVGGTDVDIYNKLQLNPDNRHLMSGSLDVSGSVKAQSFTGSLQGTASYAANANTASYALTASYVANASSFPFTGSATITGSLVVTGSVSSTGGFTGSLQGTASWANNAISASNSNTASYALNAVSSSFASTASFVANAQTASYVLNAVSASYASNADLLDGKDSTIFATTGSNTFIGNQTVTGSLFTTGSNTLVGNTILSGSVNISGSTTITGTTVFRNTSTTITGSLLVTGSTTQIGNNTLTGNTTLSGSIIISGSQGATTASVQIYGDIRQTGYHRFDPVSTNIDTSISASYIYVSGSTNDLYFSQNGSGYNNVTRLRWLESTLYTGILNGGIITSTPGSTTWNISSGSGIIVAQNASTGSSPFPTIQYVTWGNLTNIPITNSGSAKLTYVGLDNTGTPVQQVVPWGSTDINQFDTQINLGVVLHLSGSVSTGVFSAPQISYGPQQKADDFFRAFGPLKISGHTLSPSGSSPTLSIKKTGGNAYKEGANYRFNANHPSTTIENDIDTSKIYRYYISGSTPVIDTGVANAGYTTIDNTQYVNTTTGTLATVGNSNWSIQRVFWIPNSPTNAFIVYYGNAKYSTLLNAVNAKDSEPFTEAPNTATNAIFLGYIIIQGGANRDLLDPTDTTIIPGGLFRSVGGVGSSGTSPVSNTLAGLSDVSIPGKTAGDLLYYNGSQWINSKSLTGNYSITGSLNVSSGITAATVTATSFTGSLSGSATSATSASYAATASFVLNAVSSSFASTASFVVTAQTASFVQNAQTASYVLNAISSSFAATASNLSPAITNNTNNYVLTATGTGQINGESNLYFDGTNLGIGTTSPATNLNIYNAGAAAGFLLQTNSSTDYAEISVRNASAVATSYFRQYSLSASGTVLGNSVANLATFFSNFASNFAIGTLNGGSLILGTNNTERMRIDTSGNVVIGKTTANAILDVNGSAIITGSLTVTAGITGSLFGTASWALNASTSSYVLQAVSASFASTASFVTTAQTASYVLNAVSASFATTATSASFASTSSYANSGFAIGISQISTATVASSIAGANNLFTTSTGSFSGAKYIYTATSASNARMGEVLAVWNGGSVQYTDISTLDIGTTTAVTASVAIVTAQAQLNFQTSNSGWTIKSQATFL
jgi:hypothetical protein